MRGFEKIDMLAGVLAGKVLLASGMLIHEVSVLFVILNAIRLVRFGRKHNALGRKTPTGVKANYEAL